MAKGVGFRVVGVGCIGFSASGSEFGVEDVGLRRS